MLHQCEVLAPGGGFVFQQVHNIMANVPAENIIAMYDAVREYDARGGPGQLTTVYKAATEGNRRQKGAAVEEELKS